MVATSAPPEVAEAVRRKLRIAHGVLDILVAKVVLQGTSIMPIVGEFVAAGVPEHVRMHWVTVSLPPIDRGVTWRLLSLRARNRSRLWSAWRNRHFRRAAVSRSSLGLASTLVRSRHYGWQFVGNGYMERTS